MTVSATCVIDEESFHGVVTDTYDYDAFGNKINPTSTGTPNSYLYRGEQYDPDLGLYYLRARYYNPATGRFMSRDPLAGNIKIPATLHKYLYVGGDPVNRIDPRGLDSVEVALTTVSALQKTVQYANVASCGINLGILAAQSTLWTSLFNYEEDPVGAGLGGGGAIVTAIGCLTITQIPATGIETVELGDYVGLAGCAIGVAQDVWDLNNFNKDIKSGSTTLGKDEATFDVDWTSSVIGCAVPLVASLL